MFANMAALWLVEATTNTWTRSGLSPGMVGAISNYARFGWYAHWALLIALFGVAFVHRKSMVRVAVPEIGGRPATRSDVVIASTMGPVFIGFVGAMLAGPIYVALSRAAGLVIGCLVVFAAVVVTDRMIASFPESRLSDRSRLLVAAWSAIVASAVLIAIGSEFRA
jgi:hypothetical protein